MNLHWLARPGAYARLYRLFAVVFGWLGVHNFYAGETAWGYLKMGLSLFSLVALSVGGGFALAGGLSLAICLALVALDCRRGPA